MNTAIQTRQGPHGEMLHLIAAPPGRLPQVAKRDIEQAWEAAHTGVAPNGPPRGFRFLRAPAPPLEMMLNDPDAASWAVTVDRIASLTTLHGISLCLRLLNLVDLMSRAEWARAWFTIGRAGASISPALMLAAAIAPLNEAGGFDEMALRALLPQQ